MVCSRKTQQQKKRAPFCVREVCENDQTQQTQESTYNKTNRTDKRQHNTQNKASRTSRGKRSERPACSDRVERGIIPESLAYYNMIHSSNNILYYTILYYTILYYTILYYTILYYTILTILYDTVIYYTRGVVPESLAHASPGEGTEGAFSDFEIQGESLSLSLSFSLSLSRDLNK